MTTTKYFHFPAESELRDAVQEAANEAGVSMSRWLHDTIREALAEKQRNNRLDEILAKQDRILELLQDGHD